MKKLSMPVFSLASVPMQWRLLLPLGILCYI